MRATQIVLPFLAGVAAATAAVAAPAFDAAALRLDPQVQRVAEGYDPVPEPFVVANGSPIFLEPVVGAKSNGEVKTGQRVEALAMVKGREWVLIGRNGVGVGYVSRALLCPERYCKPTA